MATKQTIFACLASILLIGMASCSQEEILNNEPGAPRKTIGFNVTADRASRATGIYTSTNIPEQFTIGAWYHNGTPEDGTLYIANDCVKKTNGVYENVTDLRYWPTNPGEKLDFYAYQAGIVDNKERFSVLSDEGYYDPWIEGFAIPEDAHNHRDLVYACAYNQTEAQAKVQLTFKHALSQIAFNAKNESRHIHVEIDEVAIGGLTSKGKFYFGNGSETDPTKANTRWSQRGAEARNINYTAMGEMDETTGMWNDMPVVLTDKPSSGNAVLHDLTPSDLHKFMLLPYSYPAALEKDGRDFDNNTITGSYFRIKCKIWNIADPTLGWVTQERINAHNEENGANDWEEVEHPGVTPDVKIHDGYIYIPYAIDLKMGQKYTFTISFGKGTAGYDGDGNPTFVKVEILEPTVEEWSNENTDDKVI